MTKDPTPLPETEQDRILAFTIPGRDCRGRLVRLGPVLDEILGSHSYPPAVTHLLSEALVVTALMGGLLKDEGDQLTMQSQSKGGAVDLMVCDFRDGEIRGYVQHDAEKLEGVGSHANLQTLFGEGYLAITFDIAKSEKRYQGVVPLEGASISQAVESYFAQSEQIPSLIRTAVQSGTEGCVAAGLLVQHLPEGEEGRERLHTRLDQPQWEHVSVLAQSLSHDELVADTLPLEELVWRLYHEEDQILVEPGQHVSRGCRCTELHFENVLARFPKQDRRDMANDEGIILVDCAFCSRQFAIQD